MLATLDLAASADFSRPTVGVKRLRAAAIDPRRGELNPDNEFRPAAELEQGLARRGHQ
jgi:hypothetical protein